MYALGLSIALSATASERWWEAPLWTVAVLVFAGVSHPSYLAELVSFNQKHFGVHILLTYWEVK